MERICRSRRVAAVGRVARSRQVLRLLSKRLENTRGAFCRSILRILLWGLCSACIMAWKRRILDLQEIFRTRHPAETNQGSSSTLAVSEGSLRREMSGGPRTRLRPGLGGFKSRVRPSNRIWVLVATNSLKLTIMSRGSLRAIMPAGEERNTQIGRDETVHLK